MLYKVIPESTVINILSFYGFIFSNLLINTGKSKVKVLGGEEGVECEVCMNRMRLDHVSQFKYIGCVLDKSGTDKVECCWKVASGRRIVGVIRSLVNDRGLSSENTTFPL